MNKKYKYLIIIFLIIASTVAFAQIGNNDFINIDDQGYITNNKHIQSGMTAENIKWAFIAIVVNNWHPLTMISHMIDWSLFGANPSGHHLVSLLLHIGAVVLLFLFLNKTTNHIWTSAFAAAFFALHPLRVESVAWAAERKDVLSMFFGMASLYVYAFYAKSSQKSQYYLCLTLFALSLLSKPMLVTLPFVFLLMDYWPLERWQITQLKNNIKGIKKLVAEKIPFFILALLMSTITLWVQDRTDSIKASLSSRIFNAINSYICYLRKTFWPMDLAVFYPFEHTIFSWHILIAACILISITLMIVYASKKLPFLLVGWFWYLGTFIPVIGLVQVGMQSMADRYTYLPSIGLAMMLSWGVLAIYKRKDMRKSILFSAAMIIIVVLMIFTRQQSAYWKNSVTLLNHTVKVTKNNYLSYSIRGCAHAESFHYQLAIQDFNKAILLKPDFANAHYDRGTVYYGLGMYHHAMQDYNEAIILKPDYTDAYNNRANIYGQQGQYQRAIQDFNKVIDLDSGYLKAYNNRGLAYRALGDYKSALEDFNKAIRLDKDYAEAYYNRGVVYSKIGQHQRAFDDFNKSIFLRPNYAKAYDNRGAMYFNRGEKIRGCYDAQKSCEYGNCKLLDDAKRHGYCR